MLRGFVDLILGRSTGSATAQSPREEGAIAAAQKYPCYISVPWSIPYYLTVRGSENFHICLWIAKDLSWTQNWYWESMIFGSMALAWCTVLMYNAVVAKCFEEVYMLIALILWLSANFLWMAGDGAVS
jgi:hypothetical protein